MFQGGRYCPEFSSIALVPPTFTKSVEVICYFDSVYLYVSYLFLWKLLGAYHYSQYSEIYWWCVRGRIFFFKDTILAPLFPALYPGHLKTPPGKCRGAYIRNNQIHLFSRLRPSPQIRNCWMDLFSFIEDVLFQGQIFMSFGSGKFLNIASWVSSLYCYSDLYFYFWNSFY